MKNLILLVLSTLAVSCIFSDEYNQRIKREQAKFDSINRVQEAKFDSVYSVIQDYKAIYAQIDKAQKYDAPEFLLKADSLLKIYKINHGENDYYYSLRKMIKDLNYLKE